MSHVVVGAGYPYFKVCNTFCQIGAALADAAPSWLCELRWHDLCRSACVDPKSARECGSSAAASARSLKMTQVSFSAKLADRRDEKVFKAPVPKGGAGPSVTPAAGRSQCTHAATVRRPRGPGGVE